MKVNAEKNNGLCRLQIEGEMTISAATELKKSLLDNLANCSELEIDLSQVSEMDTTGFQLLFLVKREASLLNKVFRIISHSPKTLSVLKLYNMKDFFES
ncbi:MAG TPA: anti-sigma factor antagonist [Nitrospirae bacterium]|nr:STAS domain protein [bacterium BMS3Abin06]HDH11222.1 anti-sigma factor antagonist [Nitrospirota bacterium]HDH51620.1 anti-sigma factor antagonist [Nitrospirota bacterium]HDZ02463.1 anti-sigma factor antagonist [Nitrospirota bacterium]